MPRNEQFVIDKNAHTNLYNNRAINTQKLNKQFAIDKNAHTNSYNNQAINTQKL